jgi:hypothetical protein
MKAGTSSSTFRRKVSVTYQKIAFFIVTALKNSDPPVTPVLMKNISITLGITKLLNFVKSLTL